MADRISNAGAIAACNALVDLLDTGTGSPNLGTIKIYTGAQPADPDTAPSGTLLGTLTLANPAFGAAADATPGAVATANSIASDTSADATGTAGWFRAADSDGSAFIDGNVTLDTASPLGGLRLDDVAIVSGGTIAVSSWTVTMPES